MNIPLIIIMIVLLILLSKNPFKISYVAKVLGKTEDVPSTENTLTPVIRRTDFYSPVVPHFRRRYCELKKKKK